MCLTNDVRRMYSRIIHELELAQARVQIPNKILLLRTMPHGRVESSTTLKSKGSYHEHSLNPGWSFFCHLFFFFGFFFFLLFVSSRAFSGISTLFISSHSFLLFFLSFPSLLSSSAFSSLLHNNNYFHFFFLLPSPHLQYKFFLSPST